MMSREEKFTVYAAMVATHPDATLKGDTIPYTSMNGNMYSFLTKQDEVTLRLPEAERVKFIRKHKSKLAENYGVVQKEYVVVPEALLKRPQELKTYFKMSYDYAATLKSKPTTKAKKK